MDFLLWLTEAQADIVFTSWSKDGTIGVLVKGQPYRYWTDAMYHERWRKMARFAPGRALNEIKHQVKIGLAKQLSKPISYDKPELSCPNCGTSSPNYQPGIECPGCSQTEATLPLPDQFLKTFQLSLGGNWKLSYSAGTQFELDGTDVKEAGDHYIVTADGTERDKQIFF